MVWYALNPLSLRFFHRIIQEKVNQNGVYMGPRMTPSDLSSKQFDAPDTATSELELP